MAANVLHEIVSRDNVLWEVVSIPLNDEEIVCDRNAIITLASIATKMGVVCEWDRTNEDGQPPHLCRMHNDDTHMHYEHKVGEGNDEDARSLFERRYSNTPMEIA